MKKILNEPFAYVDEMLEGFCLAHPQYYKQTGTAGRVIVRADGPIRGKVGIVSGGGSGHLPVFTGYVGKGSPRWSSATRSAYVRVSRRTT